MRWTVTVRPRRRKGWRRTGEELEDTLKNLRTRQPDQIRATRQRVEFYLDAEFDETAETKKRRKAGESIRHMTLAERADAYRTTGANTYLRRVANAFCELDEHLIDVARNNQ